MIHCISYQVRKPPCELNNVCVSIVFGSLFVVDDSLFNVPLIVCGVLCLVTVLLCST